MEAILGDQSFMYMMFLGVEKTVALAYGCRKVCDDNLLFAIQWANQTVTRNTNTFITHKMNAIDSFTDIDKETFGGAPEYSMVMKNEGREFTPFTQDQATNLAYISDLNTDGSLFNPTNLYNFFLQYDSDRYDNIKIRFNVTNDKQIENLHYYLKSYVVPTLGNLEEKGGSAQLRAFSRLTGRALENTLKRLEHWLPVETYARYFATKIVQQPEKYGCIPFFMRALEKEEKVLKVCEILDFGKLDDIRFVFKGYFFGPKSSEFHKILSRAELASYQLDKLFNDAIPDSFGKIASEIVREVTKHYECEDIPCNPRWMARQQWQHAGITENIIEWYKEQDQSFVSPVGSVEYWDYPNGHAQELYSTIKIKLGKDVPITDEEFAKIMDPETGLVNLDVMMKFSIDMQKKQSSKQGMTLDDQTIFSGLRYLVQNGLLGGVIQKRSINDLINGYEDPLFEILRDEPIHMGGDPVASNRIEFTHHTQNKTKDHTDAYMEIITGHRKLDKLKSIRTLNDMVYINQIEPFYNGTGVQDIYYSPFEKQELLKGTDGL